MEIAELKKDRIHHLIRIPNPKLQILNKSQAPITKTFGILNSEIRAYLEFGVWDLLFSLWSLLNNSRASKPMPMQMAESATLNAGQ